MYSYLVDKENKKKAVLVPVQDYNKMLRTLKTYKKRIEELEDELDIKLANKALKENGRFDFDSKNYV